LFDCSIRQRAVVSMIQIFMLMLSLLLDYAACARSGGGAPVIWVCWPAAAAISGCCR
jgi:hypothetical protein